MRYLLAFLVPVVLVTSSLAQSGGLINGTRGIPQPNDPSGTTLYSTAIVNATGNAATAQIGNTTVPVRIVVGGAGTTGNAVLASTGTLAPCTMDAAVTSGGNFFVVESTINAGQCHPQSAAPVAGTWVIGYLHDATTTSGSTALVHVNGFVSPGAGGSGTGTVNPNPTTVGSLAYYPAAANSTTVGPVPFGTASGGGINLGPAILQFGANTTTNDTGMARIVAGIMGFNNGGNGAGETSFIRSTNSCAQTTAISFTNTGLSSTFCLRNISSRAQAWIIHCVIPWNFTGGTGSSTVQIGFTTNVAPTALSYFSTVLWGATGTATAGTASLPATSGNTWLITSGSLVATDPTMYMAYLDGLFLQPALAATISITAQTGTAGVTAQINPGAYCRFE